MNNVLLMRPDDSEFMIPDDWSGLNAKGITYEQDNRVTESFLPFKSFYCSPVCTTVELISQNNCFAMGIRYLLEKKRDLRLNHFKAFSHKCETKPDVLIMTGCTVADTYSIFSRIVEENIMKTMTPIVIITGHHSEDLCSLASKLGGVKIISPTEKIAKIENAINDAFNSKPKKIRFLTDILSPQQIETMKMVAQGRSVNEISAAMNISIKTVYAHKVRAINKLGIKKKVYEAIFYKALIQFN